MLKKRKLRSASKHMLQTAAAPWAWAVFASILGAIFAVLAYAPAAWAAHALAHLSQGRALLTQTQGTVWRGSGQLYLSAGAGSQEASGLPGRMDWRLTPNWQGAMLELNWSCCAPKPWHIQISPAWGQLKTQIAAGQLRLPAQWLSGLGAPFNTIAPSGQITWNHQSLQITSAQGRLQLQGEVNLDLTDMSSRLSTLRPLGDYRVQLLGGDTPRLQLSTLSGALKLSGQGQWLGNRLRFQGEAEAAPAQEDALSNLLNILGRRQGAKSVMALG